MEGGETLYEKGENMDEKYIFSDDPKLSKGKTFADISKSIERKYKDSKDKVDVFSKERELNHLMMKNEMAKSNAMAKDMNKIMKQGGSLNFKSPEAYKAWLAYGHASGEFAKTPGHQQVSIKGESKKVKHELGGALPKYQWGSPSTYSFGQNTGTAFAGGTTPTPNYGSYSTRSTSSYTPFQSQSGFGFNQGIGLAGGTGYTGAFSSPATSGSIGTSGPTNLPPSTGETDYGSMAMQYLPQALQMFGINQAYKQEPIAQYPVRQDPYLKDTEATIGRMKGLLNEPAPKYDPSANLRAIGRNYAMNKANYQNLTGAERILAGNWAGNKRVGQETDEMTKAQMLNAELASKDRYAKLQGEGAIAGLYSDAGRRATSPYEKADYLNYKAEGIPGDMNRQKWAAYLDMFQNETKMANQKKASEQSNKQFEEWLKKAYPKGQ